MSGAGDKLRAHPRAHATTPEGYDAEFVAVHPDTWNALAAAVDALEAIRKIDATSSYQSIYSCPTEMGSIARDALASLARHLP